MVLQTVQVSAKFQLWEVKKYRWKQTPPPTPPHPRPADIILPLSPFGFLFGSSLLHVRVSLLLRVFCSGILLVFISHGYCSKNITVPLWWWWVCPGRCSITPQSEVSVMHSGCPWDLSQIWSLQKVCEVLTIFGGLFNIQSYMDSCLS